MRQCDPALVSACGGTKDQHLVDTPGHRGIESGDRIITAEPAVNGIRNPGRTNQKQRQQKQSDKPASQKAQHVRRHTGPQHHADHGDHIGAELVGARDWRPQHRGHCVCHHRPKHPWQGQARIISSQSTAQPNRQRQQLRHEWVRTAHTEDLDPADMVRAARLGQLHLLLPLAEPALIRL